MDKNGANQQAPESGPDQEAIEYLRAALADGRDWPTALVEAAALWTVPEETHAGRHYNYFIGGEAFDWLLLAERLCHAVNGLIRDQEREELLLSGRFPGYFSETQFKGLLGVEKYRGYLNYFYGVTVEEALQVSEEAAVQKRHMSNGNRYQKDFSQEAFLRIYRTSKSILLEQFREETGRSTQPSMSLSDAKEFTYWLFKYRLQTSDKARIASDTNKGLDQLQQMRAAAASS